MAIVKQKNAKSGVIYVYDSHSYRDPVTKQPRSTRKLIGKIDENTGEIIPTRKQNRKPKSDDFNHNSSSTMNESVNTPCVSSDEKDQIIKDLRAEIDRLTSEKLSLAIQLEEMAKQLRN